LEAQEIERGATKRGATRREEFQISEADFLIAMRLGFLLISQEKTTRKQFLKNYLTSWSFIVFRVLAGI
jgi:hypothetical protein